MIELTEDQVKRRDFLAFVLEQRRGELKLEMKLAAERIQARCTAYEAALKEALAWTSDMIELAYNYELATWGEDGGPLGGAYEAWMDKFVEVGDPHDDTGLTCPDIELIADLDEAEKLRAIPVRLSDIQAT
jgi:hypothetical protein